MSFDQDRETTLQQIRTGAYDPYEALANAVIAQAAMDYAASVWSKPLLDEYEKLRVRDKGKARDWFYHKLSKKQREAVNMLADVNRFFHSDWYRAMTKMNPDYLLSLCDMERAGTLGRFNT